MVTLWIGYAAAALAETMAIHMDAVPSYSGRYGIAPQTCGLSELLIGN
jgi:hypothetical protein